MKFSEVPENTEFYWNPRKDEIPSITIRATKVPEFPNIRTTYDRYPEGCDWEPANAIGHDTNTNVFSFYHIGDDDEVELVDTPTKFKDIAVGVYFYGWPHKYHLYMKVEDVYERYEDEMIVGGVHYNKKNAVIVDLEHHNKQKMYYFKPDDYIKLWDDQVW